MNEISVIGLDVAKNVIQVHGISEDGAVQLRRQLRRHQVLRFFARLKPCLIGMEACGGTHFWARKLTELGYTVRLMPARFIKPYVKSNKNDRLDAEAICEAVQRPSMRFVSVKSAAQQGVLHLHHSRRLLVKQRTALMNHLRGMLLEFGLTVPQGPNSLRRRIPEFLEDADNELPDMVRHLLAELRDQWLALDAHIQSIEQQIRQWHRHDEASCRLADIPGIGWLTASALVAAAGDASAFRNGRQFAAWLGLVPAQASTGGRARLLGISKRGDVYLRSLLVHGARAVMRHVVARHRAGRDPGQRWLMQLLERRHGNVAAVALANHNARVVWALLRRGESYRAPQMT